ncbi:hypothetical protein LQ772_07560 [Frateuria edaphi]|uniref:hypothetical protein n=1 Tax=Frateuria edaphi TaxID=2898793 RepID=UPI001E317A4B|nr:hypothetical protein [Frateuria edaphi]UGB47130.1 hypothetical protein LQ772_07560 [Frateuria edaphi]
MCWLGPTRWRPWTTPAIPAIATIDGGRGGRGGLLGAPLIADGPAISQLVRGRWPTASGRRR